MKCRTGRPLTFNCPGTIKGWWTRCMYGTSWFATCLHSCLFNLLTYLLWSSASTVVNVAADDSNGEGGIEDVRKRPPERLEGSPADISSISSNSFFSNKRARSGTGVVLCPILYCIDVFSTYLGKILDFVVVHWSFIFVSHVSRLIVEFIWGHTYIIVHAFAFLDTFFLLLLLVRSSTPFFWQQSRVFLLLCSTSQKFPCWHAIWFSLAHRQSGESIICCCLTLKTSGDQLFLYKNSVPDPQARIPLESWDCQLSANIIILVRFSRSFLK